MWARHLIQRRLCDCSWFEGEFKQIPEAVNGAAAVLSVRAFARTIKDSTPSRSPAAYLTQADFVATVSKQQNTCIDTLEKIQSALIAERPTSIEDCAAWARRRFHDLCAFREAVSGGS